MRNLILGVLFGILCFALGVVFTHVAGAQATNFPQKVSFNADC